MSARPTAGKRRADGPAVRGRGASGGARKASRRPEPTVRSTPAPTAPEPVAAPVAAALEPVANGAPAPVRRSKAGSSKGRGAHPLVRPDARLALAAAVEALDEAYSPEGWTFDQSTILITLARRVSSTGTGHDLLAITDECYTGWVGAGQDPEELAGALFRAAPLARNQISWMLDDEVPLPVGPWILRPLGQHGWVGSRRTRMSGTRHFVVASNSRWERVASPDLGAAVEVLNRLLAP